MDFRMFVDMDSTVADFEGHYEAHFGYRPEKAADAVDWALVRSVPGFYRTMPPMPDLPQLWARIERYNPILLSGVPDDVPEATADKQAWRVMNLGRHVEIRCCRSREKYLHCRPGDINIDDWEKYRHLWVKAGGIWITHVHAAQTIATLDKLGI